MGHSQQDYTLKDLQTKDAPPPHIVDGFRFGAALDDKIRLQLNVNGNEGDFRF